MTSKLSTSLFLDGAANRRPSAANSILSRTMLDSTFNLSNNFLAYQVRGASMTNRLIVLSRSTSEMDRCWKRPYGDDPRLLRTKNETQTHTTNTTESLFSN